jgi:hypothetical protein
VDIDSVASYRLDWTVLLGVAGVVIGWFFLSSLITDLGALQLQFYFYNVLTLMHAPARITLGPYGDGATLDAWLFGTVCVAAVLAALAPVVSRRKIAWLGCLAPFALMALTGIILYHALSQDLIDNNGMLGDTGLRLSRFANELANKVSGAITRRVHVGLGGYLSMAASAYLAYKGLRGYQRAS